MSWLGDVADFESFNLGEMWNKIKKDPERAFIGAADPFSSNVWGKILGKDYEPIVDQYGGASKDVYGKAEDKGINTGPGATMHGVARMIASLYAGGAAGNAMGGTSSGAAGGAQGGTGLLAEGGGTASGMGGGTGATYGSSGAGFQAGNYAGNLSANAGTVSSSAGTVAQQQGGLLGSMQRAGEAAKPVGNAMNSASTAKGLLAEPERPPLQTPQTMTPGVGPQALAQLAAQNQQSAEQQMQYADQKRAKRRSMYRGNF